VRESFLRGREGEDEGGVISMVEGSAEKEPSGGRREWRAGAWRVFFLSGRADIDAETP
jgi:hypothetical protein